MGMGGALSGMHTLGWSLESCDRDLEEPGKLGQLAECLACESEGLSSDPWYPHLKKEKKSWAWRHSLVITALGRWGTSSTLELIGQPA